MKKKIYRYYFLFIFALLLGGGYFLLFSQFGFLAAVRLEKRQIQLQSDIAGLKHRNKLLMKQLHNYEIYAEYSAKKLGYAAQNETIFHFIKRKQAVITNYNEKTSLSWQTVIGFFQNLKVDIYSPSIFAIIIGTFFVSLAGLIFLLTKKIIIKTQC